ncbi:hypothetical protein [Pseudodesulfovibrio methanolicus]|uniref:Uncharacterized protein n=1 Tax=Pseudodesulfovibrio methanolicus TaxID=3126690 RepID=A0ABZ2IWT3_9BACT
MSVNNTLRPELEKKHNEAFSLVKKRGRAKRAVPGGRGRLLSNDFDRLDILIDKKGRG